MRPARIDQQPGEPRVTIYTPDWRNGTYAIGAMPLTERGYYAAFFAHLDAGWRIVRPLQLAAEALIYGHSPQDDVAHWVDVEITDNFRYLALACLEMIPNANVFAELHRVPAEYGCPFGKEPPIDELEPEAQALARNVRLLAMMEGAASFPQAFRGIVAPAASAFTAWELDLPTLAAPVVQYVVSRTT